MKKRLAAFVVAAGLLPACAGPPESFAMLLPADGGTDVALRPTYSWEAADEANSYRLQVSTDAAFTALRVDRTGLTATDDAPAVDLEEGTLHYWRVFAVNSAGETAATGSPKSFTTASRPGTFSLSSPAAGANGVSISALFSWTASAGAASYVLELSDNAAFSPFVIRRDDIAGTSASLPIPLAHFATYLWRVVALNATGERIAAGSPRSFSTAAAGVLPGAFSMTAPADDATGVALSPTFTWSASSGALSYTLQVSANSSFTSFVVDESGLAGTSRTPSVTLAPASPYWWRVVALNGSGSTYATSSPASFTTGAAGTIELSTTDLDFSATVGGAAPAGQVVQVSNSASGGQIRWIVESDRPWLKVAPYSGDTTTESDAVTVTVAKSQAEAWTTDTTSTNAPLNREDFAIAWTGKEMLVHGGTWGFGPGGKTDQGARYDAAADQWGALLPTAGGPGVRWGHSAVWTGKEYIVWGGSDNVTHLASGYRYDPRTNAWSGPIAAFPGFAGRRGHVAVWTGTEMIVWGGETGGDTETATGARYNPITDSWTAVADPGGTISARWHHVAVWTGDRMLVYGGYDGSSRFNTGAFYDPVTNAWTGTTSTVGAPTAVTGGSAAWSGTEMTVWGGDPGSGSTDAGARYDPAADQWKGATTTTNAPTARRSHRAIWAGDEMIVWGGYNGSGAFYDTGRRWRPPISLAAGTFTGTLTFRDPTATNSPRTVTVTFDVLP